MQQRIEFLVESSSSLKISITLSSAAYKPAVCKQTLGVKLEERIRF
jgi:hypothetical protein